MAELEERVKNTNISSHSITEETCPDCGTQVSYELGTGNPVCPNNECMRQIIYY